MKLNESRRKDRQMSRDEAVKFLQKAPYVYLSTVNPDGTPYCIPISIFMDSVDNLYIHCGKVGKKIENIMENSKVCISYAEYYGTLPTGESGYIVAYRSVVAFGTIQEVLDPEEKRQMLIGFCDRQIDNLIEAHKNYIKCVNRGVRSTSIYKIHLTEISGKQNPTSDQDITVACKY